MQASQAFALVAPAVMSVGCELGGVSMWLVASFLLIAARALWLADLSVRPVAIGIVELVGLLVVAGAGLAVL